MNWHQAGIAFFHTIQRFFGCHAVRCGICATPTDNTIPVPLCADCQQAMPPRAGGFCPHCGMLYASESLPVTPCSQCLSAPPPWKNLYFYAPYAGLLRESIISFKFHGALELSNILGTFTAAGFNGWDNPPDYIIPIPLHKERLRARGYNQSIELAKTLSKHLQVPILSRTLTRTIATPTQTGLSKQERQSNLKGAFAVESATNISDKHLLLVDDIMTTGSTLSLATEQLLAHGALQVDVAVIARTPDPHIPQFEQHT